MKRATDSSSALLVFIRDETEEGERLIIDRNMHLARASFKGESLIFCVSDMKEGYQKELFDSLHIYDD